MPSLFDSFTHRIRSLKRGRSVKRSLSTRQSMIEEKTIGAPTTSAEASAPPQSPITQMPKLEYPTDDYMQSKYNTITQKSTLTRSNTLKSNTLGPGALREPDRNFWDIRGYKKTLHRCEDGYELGKKLISCLLDRARIEEDYSKSLKQWNSKYGDYLKSDDKEYERGKYIWLSMLQTGEEVALIHSNLSEKIQQTPVEIIKTWLKDKYQKSGTSFKQCKQFEADFERAQNSWKKTFDKMKQRKKEYYGCVKKEREALQHTESMRGKVDKNDKKKKADDDYELAKIETERAKKGYEDEITKLELYVPTYQKEMKEVYKKTDDFEEARKKKFEEIFRECHNLLEEQVNSPQYKEIFENYMEAINEVNHSEDIKWWADKYGVGMTLVVPTFEEYFSYK